MFSEVVSGVNLNTLFTRQSQHNFIDIKLYINSFLNWLSHQQSDPTLFPQILYYFSVHVIFKLK